MTLYGCNDEAMESDVNGDARPAIHDTGLDDGLHEWDIGQMDSSPPETDHRLPRPDSLPNALDMESSAMDDMAGADAAMSRYPLDDQLTFSHLQGLGTHNSYHIASPIPIGAWQYTHLPLDQQLDSQGVRQFELDVRFDRNEGIFNVLHFPIADKLSTCATFAACASVLKGWSDGNRGHHPILILVEVKAGLDDGPPRELLEILEQRLTSVWPNDRLVTPDLVQGDHANLRDALREDGWPSLARLRGRALFVLHAGGALRDTYTDGLTTTAGRLMFPDAYGDTQIAVAAYHSMNDPVSGQDQIREVVRAGHLVRTRSDSDSEEANAQDYTRYMAALESGAHFISTDYPVPSTPEQYGVTIPDGSPSRCNPLTAPPECESRDIESPDRLR
jgi:hypothetical protein